MNRGAKIALYFAWLIAIAAIGWGVARHLKISSDLRSFMPPPQTADQKLLLDEIGEGPGSRLLLLAIDGAPPEPLAQLSQGLKTALQADPRFLRVSNGNADLNALASSLLPYRYLLSPTLDTHRLDAGYLRDQLTQRLDDLSSPAASMLKTILPRDPTLEILKLAQRWAPAKQPALRDGVWFSSQGEALLVTETRAPGFDPGAQAQAIAALQKHFASLPNSNRARLTISGPGYFSLEVSQRTRAEADRFGFITTLGFVILLLAAYRSAVPLLVTALPLLSGAVCGFAALASMFGEAHGITIAFGFTLLGVAQEYPIRVFSHRRAGQGALQSVRALWPLLATAIVSTCIAYLAFFASGVAGLQQLAVFTITGLIVAGACTRWLLPRVLPERFRDAAQTPGLANAWNFFAHLPRPRWLPWLVLIAGILIVAFAPAKFWENDLSALAPVPKNMLMTQARLGAELGAPDVRYLLVLRAPTADGVLKLSEKITPQIDGLVAHHAVDAVELPSRYLPSIETQRARQVKLPDAKTLQTALAQAGQGLPFRAGLFAPFVADVEAARTLPPLTPEQFEKSPLGARLQAMLLQHDGEWIGLGTLIGVHDPQAIAALSKSTGGAVHLLDLKASSESLLIAYRQRILIALGIAALLLCATVTIALRGPRRALHVLAPMTLATLMVLVVLRAAGIPLSLFHLVSLTLAAGLGLHYALFFERRTDDPAEERRTLHATLVCVISALLVFGVLALSSVPVLRAIGLTVALGVAFHFTLSVLMAPAAHLRHED
ncbi:MAG TPA: xanthomonadin transporter [Rhodanobacteraceae bacterium]|nr:xanthomonadin transporter [Rhodanobacteraceae bacterium]